MRFLNGVRSALIWATMFLVIVVMGLIIGTIVIAMFMPMFGLGELAGKQG